MSLSIQSTLKPSSEDIDFLYHGIYEEAKRRKNMSPIVPFGFFLKDEHNITVGGLNGLSYYGCLYIDQLYIVEGYRGQGWGTRLVQAAEDHGLAQNCKMVTVTTMDWEALGFYEKLNYKVISSIEGYENNSIMYFLRKIINDQIVSV